MLKLLLQPVVRGLGCLYVPRPLGAVITITKIVADRIRRALPYTPAESIIVSTDCGMKYLPREVANGKMRAIVEGAKIMRRELGG